MPDVISPHGGELVNRTVRELDRPNTTAIPVSDADLSTLYRIADGGLSPLTGPMTKAEYVRVMEEEVVVRNGKKLAWTIPLAFPVDEALAMTLQTGTTYPLVNSVGTFVGTLDLKDVYPWNKPAYNAAVYRTTRTDHPGARIANDDARKFLVGGEVKVLPQPKNPHFGDLVLSPTESRALFAKLGYKRVAAFQTRNALHRAHEFALVAGLEKLTKDGHFAGAVLNPLVGETKSDDVDAVRRMKTYRALIDNKAIGDEGTATRSCGRRWGRTSPTAFTCSGWTSRCSTPARRRR